jgi:hypothetical protein
VEQRDNCNRVQKLIEKKKSPLLALLQDDAILVFAFLDELHSKFLKCVSKPTKSVIVFLLTALDI